MTNVKKCFEVGREIRTLNPASGEIEVGKVVSYAYNNIPAKDGPTGIFVKFPDNRRSVEIDGAFVLP